MYIVLSLAVHPDLEDTETLKEDTSSRDTTALRQQGSTDEAASVSNVTQTPSRPSICVWRQTGGCKADGPRQLTPFHCGQAGLSMPKPQKQHSYLAPMYTPSQDTEGVRSKHNNIPGSRSTTSRATSPCRRPCPATATAARTPAPARWAAPSASPSTAAS
eukprot:9495586-Pyramimonas_sp.AAC.1